MLKLKTLNVIDILKQEVSKYFQERK